MPRCCESGYEMLCRPACVRLRSLADIAEPVFVGGTLNTILAAAEQTQCKRAATTLSDFGLTCARVPPTQASRQALASSHLRRREAALAAAAAAARPWACSPTCVRCRQGVRQRRESSLRASARR
eukprot:5333097-Pleurochrysis_carterae.AAC.2